MRLAPWKSGSYIEAGTTLTKSRCGSGQVARGPQRAAAAVAVELEDEVGGLRPPRRG